MLPDMILIIRTVPDLNRLLKRETTEERPVNHEKEAAAAPAMNGMASSALRDDRKAPSISVPSIIA